MRISIRNTSKCIIFCLLVVQVSSCTTFYFEQPLPADRPNINGFPTHLTGVWQSIPDTGVYMINFPDSGKTSSGANSMPFYWKTKTMKRVPFNSSDDSLSLLVDETFFAVIINRIEKIARGAWPKLNKAREFVYPEGEVYKTEQVITYDSLRQPVDTVDQYIFRNSKMYAIEDDGSVSTGRTYLQDQDIITMKTSDTVYYDLGKNAVLRQLNDRFYAVSFRGSVIGERNNWWQLYIIEKKADHVFSTWECSRKTKDLPSLIYIYQDHTFYFNATWTTVELLQLMNKGYFVETDEFHLKQ
jgi:hypothetical protein